MSAYFMVFDKSKAPRDGEEFKAWLRKKAKWEADRDYDDIKGTSQELADFYMEIKESYPPMNGPYAPSDEEIEDNPELETMLTDYCIDDDLIYMAFVWSVAENAAQTVFDLAVKHNLGFYDMDQAYWIESEPKKKSLFSRLFK